MAKKEKTTIDLIVDNKTRIKTKAEERIEKLRLEQQKLKERIRQAEIENAKKREKKASLVFNKMTKEIKDKTGIMFFLKHDINKLKKEDAEIFLNNIISHISEEIKIAREKGKIYYAEEELKKEQENKEINNNEKNNVEEGEKQNVEEQITTENTGFQGTEEGKE